MSKHRTCAPAKVSIHSGQRGYNWNLRMFEELIKFNPDVDDDSAGFVPLEKSHPANVVDAQVKTANWLTELGAVSDDELEDAQVDAARTAFTGMVTQNPDTNKQLSQIKTPAAVQHLVGMLTAYDWQFVEQAQQLRGYAVAKILEDCEHPTASVRLKALALLGKVTEIGLFTERVEIKKTELSDSELEARIKEKLSKMAQIVDITDVTDVEESTDEHSPESE